MARRYYSSIAVATTLSGSITSGATSLTVAATTGWPSSYPFTILIDEDTAYEELVTVTATSGGGTFTVTRGSDGTTAQAHSNGAAVRHAFSARDLDEPNAHIAASSAVHGLTGTVVGTTDTQTLTNKTISGASNTLSSIDKASVTNTAVTLTDTQTLTNKTLTSPAISSPALSGTTTGTPTIAGATLTTPTIASFTNATHDHSNAAGGGNIPQASVTNLVSDLATKITASSTSTLTNKTIDGDDNTLTDIAASSIKKSAWTSYTPTLGGTGWAVGNGTIAGRYIRIGNTVHFRAQFTLGSTSTAGSISPTLTLPLTAEQTASFGLGFPAIFGDADGLLYTGFGFMGNTWNFVTLWATYTPAGSGSQGNYSVTSSSGHPFASSVWAAGDIMNVHGTYETDAA